MGQNPPMDKHIRQFSAETKALDDSRSLIVTITTPTPDRSGDVVVPKGGRLEHFLKNPVVLFGHKYDEPPIAKAEDLVVTETGIKAKVTFPEEGVYAFADAIYGLIKAGIMHAWSIGFQASRDDVEQLPGGGLKFNGWDLLEFSAVPVPANPEALTILRSKGLADEQVKELIEGEVGEVEASKEIEAPLTVEVGIKNVSFNFEDDTYTLTYLVNGDEQQATNPMSDELKAQFPLGSKSAEELVHALKPNDTTQDVAKALSAMRDALRPADKQIGLALRTLKTLLDQPTQGEEVKHTH